MLGITIIDTEFETCNVRPGRKLGNHLVNLYVLEKEEERGKRSGTYPES